MKLSAEMELAHLNFRVERAGDEDGPAAADIKLVAILAAIELAGIFATEVGYGQLMSFYRQDGELETGEWESLSMRREAMGVRAELSFPISETTVAFDDAKFNKIRLEPLAGFKVKITARLQVKPEDYQCGDLVEMMHKTIRVTIDQAQGELFEQKPEAAAESEAQQQMPIEEGAAPQEGSEEFSNDQHEPEFAGETKGHDRAPHDPQIPEAAPLDENGNCERHVWGDEDDSDIRCINCGEPKPSVEAEEKPLFTEVE